LFFITGFQVTGLQVTGLQATGLQVTGLKFQVAATFLIMLKIDMIFEVWVI